MPVYVDAVIVCRDCGDEVTVRTQLLRDLGSHYAYGISFDSVVAQLTPLGWRNIEYMVAGTHASFCNRETCQGCAASGTSPRDWFCRLHPGNFQVVRSAPK